MLVATDTSLWLIHFDDSACQDPWSPGIGYQSCCLQSWPKHVILSPSWTGEQRCRQTPSGPGLAGHLTNLMCTYGFGGAPPSPFCYGSHRKCGRCVPSHRTSRDPPEMDFYKLLLHDKNGPVVVREALLVQRLNHREHSSLPNSSSVLSKLQVLRRTATRVRV